MSEPDNEYAPYKNRDQHDQLNKAAGVYGRAKAHLIKVEVHYVKAREALDEMRDMLEKLIMKSNLKVRSSDRDEEENASSDNSDRAKRLLDGSYTKQRW